MPPTSTSGFTLDHMLSSALTTRKMKIQFGRRGNAPRGMRATSSSSSTTAAVIPTIGHVGAIDTISASSAATRIFVPAHRRCTGEVPGTY